jgi:hypothetical protein
MKRPRLATVPLSALLAVLGASAAAQSTPADAQKPSCPMHATHEHEQAASHDHHAGVDARGDREMGFSHAKTTHHFRLMADGGAIEVSANEASDIASRDQIRAHLREIAKAFSDGRFETPMAVHDRVPPGVPTMARRKAEISYRYEQTELGARVRIATTNPDALDAVHDFLRFQIEDHRTGDPLEVAIVR